MATNIIQTKGKRKRAVARATLTEGKGKIRINGTHLESYGTEMLRLRIHEPLLLAGSMAQNVDINVLVVGGGVNGQADAIRLAIARSLIKHEPKLKKTFEEYENNLQRNKSNKFCRRILI